MATSHKGPAPNTTLWEEKTRHTWREGNRGEPCLALETDTDHAWPLAEEDGQSRGGKVFFSFRPLCTSFHRSGEKNLVSRQRTTRCSTFASIRVYLIYTVNIEEQQNQTSKKILWIFQTFLCEKCQFLSLTVYAATLPFSTTKAENRSWVFCLGCFNMFLGNSNNC